jgi:hypothetical protein
MRVVLTGFLFDISDGKPGGFETSILIKKNGWYLDFPKIPTVESNSITVRVESSYVENGVLYRIEKQISKTTASGLSLHTALSHFRQGYFLVTEQFAEFGE